MADVLGPALEWAARAGPPNALFVLALLTHPSTWTDRALAAVRKRLGGSDDDLARDPDARE